MKKLALFLFLMPVILPAIDVVAMPGQSPLIQFRIVFRAGSVNDPKGKPGAASLAAAMLTGGGTKAMSYQQILDAMYPMAARFGNQVDKEMIVFSGATHVDNLEAFYGLFRDALLTPGWREDDLKRVRDDLKNSVSLSLRENNDEELGKELLYSLLYKGHPYEHLSLGNLSSIDGLTHGRFTGLLHRPPHPGEPNHRHHRQVSRRFRRTHDERLLRAAQRQVINGETARARALENHASHHRPEEDPRCRLFLWISD